MSDEHMRIAEAAKRLEVSQETVRKWLVAGTLKGRRIGGLWFVSRPDLEALMRSIHT